MSTVGQLIDRILREYLALPDDQPTTTRLSQPMDASSVDFTLDVTLLLIEELNLIAPGTILEVETELMRVLTFAEGTGVGTATRGVLGTTAAAHATFAELRVAPSYTRQMLLDAVAHEVEMLFPELWATTTLFVDLEPVTPIEEAQAFGLLHIADLDGNEFNSIRFVRYLGELEGPGLIVPPRLTGVSAYATVMRRFPRPTAESDDLASVNFLLEPAYEEVVMLGAVARCLQGRELDQASIEYLTEALEAQGIRLGEITNVATALLRYQALLKLRALRSLKALWPVSMEVVEVL